MFCPHSLLQRSPLFLFLTFVSCHEGIFSELFPFFVGSAASCIWHLCMALRHRNKFVNKIVVTQWINSFPCNMISMILVKRSFHALPRRFVGFNDACVFCLTIIQKRWQVSLYSSRLVLQGIAAGIGTSNFQRAFSIIPLNSSSAGSMK